MTNRRKLDFSENRMDFSSYQLTADIWLDARRAAWFAPAQVLAVADLHLGYGWAQRSRGYLLPLSQPDDAVERLLELQACYRPREIVLLGDIIHRALSLPKLKSELKELCERLSKQSVLTWMVGNHDRRLDELLADCDLSIQLKKEISVGPHLLVHGDADDPATVRTAFQKVEGSGGRIVMGHEHPAVSVGDGVATSARCPCFLVGDQVLILPAFSPWAAGVLVRNKSFMSGLARKATFTQAIAILGDKLLALPVGRISTPPATGPVQSRPHNAESHPIRICRNRRKR